jgi:hypothetical protein
MVALDRAGWPPIRTPPPGAGSNESLAPASRIVPTFAGMSCWGSRTALSRALPTVLAPSDSQKRPTTVSHPSSERSAATRFACHASISAA